MGSSLSCVPHHSFQFSGKNFIRRNSRRLFRKKNPEEGQVKSNSIINILCTVTPRKEMSSKDLETIENIKWDPPFAYDPSAGWKKSSVNVKNYGRMIHSSKVQFRFLHCQDIHDCFLDLFQTHLHFVSNTTTGLTYQGTLPLRDLTVCKLQPNGNDTDRFGFEISGVGLNPIIVYCCSQEELETWFGYLKEHVEGNGGTVTEEEEAKTFTRVKNPECMVKSREELRNSVKNEPIYEWEGTHRDSLGPVTYVSKVKVQHLPCEEQYERLLVMYSSTIIILSEESNGLFYKGKLPLNSINVTTPCQEVKPNTFMIEGRLINPIIVTCMDENEFSNWISHFKIMQVPVLLPPPPVYDIIYTPTESKEFEFDRWSVRSHREQRCSQKGRELHKPSLHNYTDNLTSPGYSTPLCFSSKQRSSGNMHEPPYPNSRTGSMSSQIRPVMEPHHRTSLRGTSAHYGSNTSTDTPRSPVYNSPYRPVEHSASYRREQEFPLVKSNSWSVPWTPSTQQLSVPQRNSDVCMSRKNLSILYDDPWTPVIDLPGDNYVKPAQMSRQHWARREDPSFLPSSFRLQPPPIGRCKAHLSYPHREVTHTPKAEGFKLLSPPIAVSRQRNVTQVTPQPDVRHHLLPEISADYSQEDISYLEPAEPDDQEVDYDNIWDFDCDNEMAQPLSQIPAYRASAE
ncbi:probable pleckstrin homology domain-containing family N member 1 isoform X2 [Brienomyrus brachyistius]|uniref:probable pleckstrin homology domain-containing family N member 1 isoform X2 n=1 Tax=Brienomyrus brachyistius TaxID=42636 RepID=UPI0020B35DC8|nr:probable pleckstrin homology domain-containing family N member 1 isoform X2 [Brienomyrus brachyistius]